VGPGDLDRALCGLCVKPNPNVIIGFERGEDAGVYRISDDLAIVQTVDFFTPIVDDPRTFGRIAAANALSDIYAMGAEPICALNIAAFPAGKLDISILNAIFVGGLEKLEEAGVALLGGHTVDDKEIKYGLAVTGVAKPGEIVFNSGARVGDVLVITKPIGTGIISTAQKVDEAPEESLVEAVRWMETLNAGAARAMKIVGVHAATDVTGFGLIGHLAEMTIASGAGAKLYLDRIPLMSNVLELANEGMVPGGTRRNQKFREHMLELDGDMEAVWLDVLFDPQTSGGLLIAVAPEKADELLKALDREGAHGWVIGEIVDGRRISVGRG